MGPSNEYGDSELRPRQDWIHLVASRHAPLDEILIWVSTVGNSSQGLEPWHGRGFSTNPYDLSLGVLTHELGHYLGLPHTFGLPNDAWGLPIPNPETGENNTIDEYWDLIFGLGAGALTFFSTKGEAEDYSLGTKYPINWHTGSHGTAGSDNCTYDLSTCTTTFGQAKYDWIGFRCCLDLEAP